MATIAEEVTAYLGDEYYRVLVTGSREWTNIGLLSLALDHAYAEAVSLGKTMVLIEGLCSKGADKQARNWADVTAIMGTHVEVESYKAYWDLWGRGAGYRRNHEMVELGADVCLAFIKDYSEGSSHTAFLAQVKHIHTLVFRE